MSQAASVTRPLQEAPAGKTAVLLIGHGSRDEAAISEYHQFAASLSHKLHRPVEACFLEFADPPIVDGIRACVENGATNIVALPLFLGPAGHQKNDVPAVINWARKEWPEVRFHYGTPLGAQHHLIRALAERAEETIATATMDVSRSDTAVVVLGRGSRDPDSNSEVAKLARLLYEGRGYGVVEHAFYALSTPTVAEIVQKCARVGAKRVVLLPHLLFTGRIYHRIREQAAKAAKIENIEVLVSSYLYPHPGMLEAVASRYEEALGGVARMTCDLCKYRNRFAGFENEFGLPQTSDHSHGLRGVPHSHGFEQRIEEILPPRYQGGAEVSFAPMGSAELKYGDEGKVAWNEMWQSFCDLALAGGPTHRGILLEAPTAEEVRAHLEKYERVVEEIERGIRLVTGLATLKSPSLGWVGMKCRDEEMAVWLLRAIIVENVMVRRQQNVIYVPAGPEFRIEKEIKNVITVVAKTNHYWTEHMTPPPVS
jgi:sirohydrochlorin cobaltochelatase